MAKALFERLKRKRGRPAKTNIYATIEGAGQQKRQAELEDEGTDAVDLSIERSRPDLDAVGPVDALIRFAEDADGGRSR